MECETDEISWDDDEEEESLICPYCGIECEYDEGWLEHEMECPNQDTYWMKAFCSSDESLDDLINNFSILLEDWKDKKANGWKVLSVDNGLIHLVREALL